MVPLRCTGENTINETETPTVIVAPPIVLQATTGDEEAN